MKDKIIFVVGPTAGGKTAAAAILAKKIGAEIISCDSMQVYKGMDVITSKPPQELRKKIRHYLIDTVRPAASYDVSRFRRSALAAVKKILEKGKIPLFVGGTGLYMTVLLDGIFKQKAADPAVRQRLYALAEKYGSIYLYKRLQKVDPNAACKVHPNDTKRIIRALEVYMSTGRPISELQKQRHGLSADYDVRVFCLDLPRDLVYRRIEERVDEMFDHGLVREVKRLLSGKLGRTAVCAIGLREIKGYFDGKYDLAEAKRLIKLNTRRYAKRQLTWFRKDKRIKWIEVSENDTTKMIAQKIWKECF